MITPTPEPHVDWTSPAALWDQFNGATNDEQRRVFRTPAILRFATDAYMDELIAVMKNEPHRLAERLAVPEKWTKPVAEPEATRPKRGLIGQLEKARAIAVRKLAAREGLVRKDAWNAAPQEEPLKLYQPAAQRFYVVTACLVCRTLGLPDRPVNTAMDERVAFVLRRLRTPDEPAVVNPDPAAYDELAFVDGEWKPVASKTALEEGEELYLMSPLTYAGDDGRKRRMYNGVIPVAKREALIGASAPEPGSTSPPAVIDPRKLALELQVIGPWSALDDVAAQATEGGELAPGTDDSDAHTTDQTTAITQANNQIQSISWLIALDLARWLKENLNPVWRAVQQGSGLLSDPRHIAAYQQLDRLTNHQSLLNTLLTIESFAPKLEDATIPYDGVPTGWPSPFLFVTAPISDATRQAGPDIREAFEDALVKALDPLPPAKIPPPVIARASASSHVSPWFTVRCVYDRPNCGALAPSVVSEPTASFQLASFFDPDAPARPIRVELPQDTTPAGLRKHDKNTAFVMSDILCGQFGAIRGMTFGNLVCSVLPWPFHKNLNMGDMSPCPNGMVCSFSIPIITICALILLMIIVKLLDIVFFWMPFFQICLPIPKFDGKKG